MLALDRGRVGRRARADEGRVSDRLLTAGEVAELLSVPETWVRAETRAGRLPHLALGRYRRYDRDAVLGWLEAQRAGQWRKHAPKAPA
jgi:excisionase family DNA binding protein